MDSQTKMRKILLILKSEYPVGKTALKFNSPFRLLIATILSAQCTDKRVNLVTPELFAKYPTPYALASANPSDVEKIIHSTGFFKSKTKAIISCAKKIESEHSGKLPKSLPELVKLPGVGRKTANVLLWNAFNINEGIAVDTHVKRISFLLHLTNSKDPIVIEKDLMKITPVTDWGSLTNLFINHGRQTCIANRPRCKYCQIEKFCPSSLIKGKH